LIDLADIIDKDTFIVSDTHFGHAKVLTFEPIRVEYLADYNTDVVVEAERLLELLQTIPSDIHRTHQEIQDLAKFLIPFHDEMLIEKWNSVIGENDNVLHLGDFAFKGIAENTAALNGNKILLRGNHDLKSSRTYIEAGFRDVIETVKIVVGNFTYEKIPQTDKFWNGLVISIRYNKNDFNIMFSHYPPFNNNKWDVKKYGNITNMLEEIYTNFGCEVSIAGHTHSEKSIFGDAVNVSIEHCTSLMPMRLGTILDRL
jgi:calcineurin-like phosphoesterase family protein